MEPVTAAALQALMQGLGERCSQPATLYLLGGSALCLLGSPRQTLDLDYTVEIAPEAQQEFLKVLADLAAAQHLDLEEVPISQFVPLPANGIERRRLVGRFGSITVYIFDPYAIALSKIARGFESDLEDVLFMIRTGVVQYAELEEHFHEVLPRAAQFDIDSRDFRAYFAEIRRQMKG
jgi:hypothetical protein